MGFFSSAGNGKYLYVKVSTMDADLEKITVEVCLSLFDCRNVVFVIRMLIDLIARMAYY